MNEYYKNKKGDTMKSLLISLGYLLLLLTGCSEFKPSPQASPQNTAALSYCNHQVHHCIPPHPQVVSLSDIFR
ncbi:hypothetical protein IPC737_02325 [Pseudomonas aeruginosa]|nr:hypothetical protein APB28_00930 [Pseudomonas aeruginosa]RPW79318.1 hypothetical protein IPC737_02325 [Pseudomonas aeruginosa]VFT05218.1 Uncharacterised protein [Pseudomonas aeruginosa]